jgi:hypothetical protein
VGHLHDVSATTSLMSPAWSRSSTDPRSTACRAPFRTQSPVRPNRVNASEASHQSRAFGRTRWPGPCPVRQELAVDRFMHQAEFFSAERIVNCSRERVELFGVLDANCRRRDCRIRQDCS